MDIEKRITITLSEADVKEIIAEYMAHKGYKVFTNNVELVVGNEWVSYGFSEYQKPVFKKCTITLKGE